MTHSFHPHKNKFWVDFPKHVIQKCANLGSTIYYGSDDHHLDTLVDSTEYYEELYRTSK